VNDKALLVMPLCHANSLYFANTFIHLGACIVVDDRVSFDPEHLLMLLSKHEITFTSMVPTHYIMMLALPEDVKKQYATQSVGRLLVSSAPANANLKRAIQHMFPNGQLYELYGSTEAGWVTLLRPDEQLRKLGSVGREWVGSGPIKLLDAQRQEVPDGEVGELACRGPYTLRGYYGVPEYNARQFTPDGFYRSGDLMRKHPSGNYVVEGRKKDLINRGGEKISAEEIENLILMHPAVQNVACVPMPDPAMGEKMCACVILKAGQSLNLGELVAFLAQQEIAKFKLPERLEILPDFPVSTFGKVSKKSLGEMVADKLAAKL
jgi:2,3-dihydroxybenzoate-AMP ligase